MIIKQRHLDRVYAEAAWAYYTNDTPRADFLTRFLDDLEGRSDSKTGGAWLRSQVDDGREYPFDAMVREDIGDSHWYMRWTSEFRDTRDTSDVWDRIPRRASVFDHNNPK